VEGEPTLDKSEGKVTEEDIRVFHAVALLLAQEGLLWEAVSGATEDAGARVYREVLARRRDAVRARCAQWEAEAGELERRLGQNSHE